MKPEQKRIVIAEACGYRSIKQHRSKLGGYKGRNYFSIPNYLKDLNAIHEAEKVLTQEQEENYVLQLSEAIMADAYEEESRYTNSKLCSRDSAYRATAEQRADSFIKTIGKWEKTK